MYLLGSFLDQKETRKLIKENENLKAQLYILKKKLIPVSKEEDDKENEAATRPKRSNSMVVKDKSAKPFAILHQRKSRYYIKI